MALVSALQLYNTCLSPVCIHMSRKTHRFMLLSSLEMPDLNLWNSLFWCSFPMILTITCCILIILSIMS